MEVVINNCYGGFRLSHLAEIMFLRKKGFKDLYFYKTVRDGNFDMLGYEKVSEQKYVNSDKDIDVIVCSKKFEDFIRIPNNRTINNKEEIFQEFNECLIYYHNLIGNRNEKDLLDIIKAIGVEKASGRFSCLKIIEIPDGVKYVIEEYDGMEWVSEVHRTWR